MRALTVRFALFLLRRFGSLRVSDELADVVAYLERRRRRAETIHESGFDEDWRARAIAGELSVVIGDLAAGLHHGCAELGRMIDG